MSNQAKRESLERLLTEIKDLHGPLSALAGRFRTALQAIEHQEEKSQAQYSAHLRSVAVIHDALVRVRILIEQNFFYLETLGMLALTRYIFELTVWIKLMQKDNRYGMVFYRELANKQKRYYQDLLDQLRDEHVFLKETSKKEQELLERRLDELKVNPNPVAASSISADIQREIDAAAARRFTIYGEQARTNGYSFQAYLIQAKVVPQVEASLKEIEQETQRIDASLTPDIRKLMKDDKWKDRAGIAGMSAEFSFIYSYTSRLLHATPVSIMTDQKNLEVEEIEMFLRYVKVRITDLLEVAEKMLPV